MKKVITIGRQCGSGGHTIGQMVAERLNWELYDKKIIKAVAEKSGLTEETVEREGEYSTTSLLFNIATRGISAYNVANKNNMLMRDLVNAYQTDYIKEVAAKGSCVIIGRSADYILSDRDDCLNVFICGDLAERAERVVKEHDVDPRDAENHVLERDKKRAKYYRHITDKVWGDAKNYDLCLNSSELGIDKCVEMILACCK